LHFLIYDFTSYDLQVNQKSILLYLKIDSTTGRCPEANPNIGPLTPSFHLDGISSVYKRLFEPFCEIQILLKEGGEVLNEWQVMVSVLDFVLQQDIKR
jgi:hypothetical protein